MKKIILLAVILVSASLVYGNMLFEPVTTQSNTYIYPDNFLGLTLDQAINSTMVNGSDTIIVRNGTYFEHLNVSKSITLEGNLGGPTILDGTGNGTVVTVNASNVTLVDFTIQNGFEGILLNSTNNSNLKNNLVRSNDDGILILNSSNNTLRDNVMRWNSRNFGINANAAYPQGFIQDVDPSNLVDNRPIYYCVNKTGGSIPSNAGFVALVNSTNVAVENLSINHNDNGILLAYTFNSTIENNTLSQNNVGIALIASEHDEIMNNNMTDNTIGLSLYQANDSIFVYNTIEKKDPSLNTYGVALEYSNNNTFYRNNFIQIGNPLSTIKSSNSYNNSREGNYWDSYIGNDTNLDGISETPNSPFGDYHPLMEKWQAKESFNVSRYGKNYYFSTLCNSTVARVSVNWNQTLKRICFNVTSGTPESIDVTIPRDWLEGPFEIKLNSTDVQPSLLRIVQDENNSYVSIGYNPGAYMVEIIGVRVLGYRSGDLNNDGIVNIYDAIILAGSFNKRA